MTALGDHPLNNVFVVNFAGFPCMITGKRRVVYEFYVEKVLNICEKLDLPFMTAGSQHLCAFSDFEFDSDGLALYHQGELVKKIDKKALEVLSVLLRQPNEVVRHDDIIDQVWGDNSYGVTPVRVNQYVSKLQKVLATYEPDRRFIENLKGRGYIFKAEVRKDYGPGPVVRGQDKDNRLRADNSVGAAEADPVAVGARLQSTPRRVWYITAAAVVLVGLIAGWAWFPRNEAEEIKRVVKESQMFESLVLYKNPSVFSEADLDKYWTTELDLSSNYDRQHIRTGIKNLLDKGLYYGSETKCEQFEFQSVEVNVTGDMAVVKTLEKWFIAVYFNDSKLKENKFVGPYFVSYVLRKIDGRWLIEKSSTARANPPTPVIAGIEPVTEIRAGQQFFVKLTGNSFVPQTVYLNVIGPGCPEASPCSVPNSALRMHSELTENVLSNVPLTLASGEFTLYVRNGESKPSNSVRLVVP